MMRYASAANHDPYYHPPSDPYLMRDRHPRDRDPSGGYRGPPSREREPPIGYRGPPPSDRDAPEGYRRSLARSRGEPPHFRGDNPHPLPHDPFRDDSHRDPRESFWEEDSYRPSSTHLRSRGDHHREPPANYRFTDREPGGPHPHSRSSASSYPHPHAPSAPEAAISPAAAAPSGVLVSNITNSDDFASKDSRVFVGNLNTVTLSKEDVHRIFARLGHVTGISMHKGYAFVQFSSPGEARRAIALENGQTYGGQALDLNVVSQPKNKGAAPKMSGGFEGMKRGIVENTGERPAKRSRPTVPEVGNASLQRGNLVTLANSDHPSPSPSQSGREPSEVGCAQCDAVFTSAWSLCLHFQQRHHVTIFRTKSKRMGP